MHSPAQNTPAVPGIVTETVLQRLIAIGHDLRADRPLTDEAGRLIVASLLPVAEELLNTRRKLAVIADLAEPGNVFILAGR